jgi:serine/threonine-protein kinase
MEAYDAFMRSMEYNTYHPDEVRVRIKLLKRAVELDPKYVDAYGVLAQDCIWMVRLGEDIDGEHLNTALAALNEAKQIADQNRFYLMGQARYEYYIEYNFDGALKICQRVIDRYPNNSDAFSVKSAILRRQGRWQKGLEARIRAVELDPRNELWELGNIYQCLRQFDSAMAAYNRLLAFEPDHSFATRSKAKLLKRWKGDLHGAKRIMENAVAAYGNIPGHNTQMAEIELSLRKYDKALGHLAGPIIGQQYKLSDYYMLKASIYYHAGQKQMSHIYYDSALDYFDRNVARGSAMAEANYYANYAIVLAGLDRYDEAISMGERARDLMPISKDHMEGTQIIYYLAKVYTRVGRKQDAIDLLEQLMSIPSYLTVWDLKIEPIWDPLRDHPRFQALIEKYEKEHGI